MKNTYIFIDGTNLFASQFELFGPNQYINFPKFIEILENSLKIHFDKIFFYASYTPRKPIFSKRDVQFITNEFLFYKSVKQTKRVVFFKGYRSKSSGKEKEIDVKLSVDMVGFAFLNKYQNAYLFSGDADFLQAAHFIKEHLPDISLHLICVSNKILFKGLFYYPSHIFTFRGKSAIDKKVAEKAKCVELNSEKILVKIKRPRGNARG